MKFDRRDFLKLSLAMSPPFLFSQLTWAAVGGQPQDPILVVVFLRGAMDGISFLPPVEDVNYKLLRPNISISPPNLKDGFGLHPALSEIRQIFNQGEASFLFEAGSPANTRSHFDAQDWMESGALKMGTDSGFLARAAAKIKPAQTDNELAVVAVQNGLPRSLKGTKDGIAFSDFKSLKLQGPLTHDKIGGEVTDEGIDPAILKLFGQSDDLLFRSAAHSFLSGSSVLQRAEQIYEKEKPNLPKPNLAKNLGQISAMIRSKLGLRIAVTEMGGWDTHVNQGNAEKGSLRDRFAELDSSISSFWKSIGEYHDQVCVVVMTEFGRTVQENGDRGTDHGHGSTFMILNGRLKPQKIHQQFKGFAKDQLHEGRDLQVKFDYRQIFSEVLRDHSRIQMDSKALFPEFIPGPNLGFFRS